MRVRQKRILILFHKFIYRFAQTGDGGFISHRNRVHHAVKDMVLQNHLAGVILRGAYRGKLDQHFGAVVSFLHHPLYFF